LQCVGCRGCRGADVVRFTVVSTLSLASQATMRAMSTARVPTTGTNQSTPNCQPAVQQGFCCQLLQGTPSKRRRCWSQALVVTRCRVQLRFHSMLGCDHHVDSRHPLMAVKSGAGHAVAIRMNPQAEAQAVKGEACATSAQHVMMHATE
jgi:hypothetical protein